MDVSQAIYSQLKATAGVTALSSYRIYPMASPQGALFPHVIYQQISNTPVHAMIADPKIRRYRFQLSCWATSFTGVVALSTQVKSALRDKTGVIGTSNFNVQRIFFDNEYDLTDVNPETEKIIFHRAQDYLVWTTG